MKATAVKIKDIAEVLPGFSTKGAIKNEPGGTHQVIMARHLTKDKPHKYIEEHHLRITPERNVDKYTLHPGDILFMSRGSKNLAYLLESFPEPAIAPSTFYILKPQEGVVPGYLSWCINQIAIQVQLNELRTGAGAPMIPRQGFMDVWIPLPDLENQKKFAELAALLSEEYSLRKNILEETEKLHTIIGYQALTKLFKAAQEKKNE